MTQTFDQWFQLRLDSLRRQNEWRKIDCLLFVKEYLHDAWEADQIPQGFVLVPVEPTAEMLKLGSRAYWNKQRDMDSPTPTEFPDECGGPMGYAYLAMLSAAPKEPTK